LFAGRDRALKAAVSVLIVACPCALALAAPFTLGTAVRLLGRRQIYLKGPQIIESLSEINAVVFDKTGTLTSAGAGGIRFKGGPLTAEEQSWLYSVARHSTHPFSVRIAELLYDEELPIRSFQEIPGRGIAGTVAGCEIRIGSAAWLSAQDVQSPKVSGTGSVAHVAINGEYRGHFALAGALRPDIKELVKALSTENRLALLSGDNEKERDQFENIFGAQGELRFNQGPLEKLQFIRDLQNTGKTVLMVGDGLNDAGALQQSNVGVAVVENTGAFSPASDIIMSASMVPRLAALLRFSKNAVKVVRLSFMISSLYNVIGISIAASGLLSPIVCAILMPLSSVTVVAFSCGVTAYLGRRANFSGPELEEIAA
jgi:Cu+-exporting ATPase